MIGVISTDGETEICREFFELFKVPWEFYKENGQYNVVILKDRDVRDINAKLIIIYSSNKVAFDDENNVRVNLILNNKPLLKCNGVELPVYGKISTVTASSNKSPQLETTSGQVVGIEFRKNDQKIIRVGFDLFQEIHFLLTAGQPVEHSTIPTLDEHISILRNWILNAGIPLVEILPVPAGYNFTCCLTHDIDFAGIRRHKFDRTIFGFLYRALFGSFRDFFTGRGSLAKLYRNWKAVFMLPAVYMGAVKDFWMPFESYRKIENDLKSTFFIVPLKNYAGTKKADNHDLRRALRYDCTDVEDELKSVLSDGCEIGVHGLDSWWDTETARREMQQIREATGSSATGIRMHWLYFDDKSPQKLEEAGFLYDSTLGYNDAVGYRGGTVQAYRPTGAKKLLELPLNIQDTALFFPDRMGLNEEEAWQLVHLLIVNANRLGGVLTVNWHDRSLAPERLWGNTYSKLLNSIRGANVWIATASRVTKWFNKRRSALFNEVSFDQDSVKLSISCEEGSDTPDLVLRIYAPPKTTGTQKPPLDIQFKGALNAEYPI